VVTKAASKTVGETVEDLVTETVSDLEAVAAPEDYQYNEADYWHDATPTRALFPSHQLPMAGLCAIEPGTPVEIKACRATISDGTETRTGRFQLHRPQHERLVEEDGVYLFALYSDTPEGPALLGLLAVLAVVIEEERRDAWYAVDGREDYYQLSASRLPIDGLGGDSCAE
jgi:hypothetical protein